MRTLTVVLDANVLIPIRRVSALLWAAEASLFQPMWSEPILREVERNLPKLGITRQRASRRVGLMREAFGDESLIVGFENKVPEMTCDPKDAHVLAAAVHEKADMLVAFNLKDFPLQSTEGFGVLVLDPDQFLLSLLRQQREELLDALETGLRDLRNPPEDLNSWLAGLSTIVPRFVQQVRELV